MGDGLFLAGLGAVVMLIGLLRIAPRAAKHAWPRSTGYLRGQEIGSYIAMGLGGVLVVLGLGAVVMHVLS